MAPTTIRFTSFPRTQPPPSFIEPLIALFRVHESGFATKVVKEALDSNGVLSVLRDGLAKLGFHVEQSKYKAGKIERPVFYGENGVPTLRYQIDAYHEEWRCGLEVEAGRAWMGNAVYRDLIQAMVMVQVDHLCLAVPNEYRYQSSGKTSVGQDLHKHPERRRRPLRTHRRENTRIISASVREMLDAFRIQATAGPVTDKALEEIVFRAEHGVLQSFTPYPRAQRVALLPSVLRMLLTTFIEELARSDSSPR